MTENIIKIALFNYQLDEEEPIICAIRSLSNAVEAGYSIPHAFAQCLADFVAVWPQIQGLADFISEEKQQPRIPGIKWLYWAELASLHKTFSYFAERCNQEFDFPAEHAQLLEEFDKCEQLFMAKWASLDLEMMVAAANASFEERLCVLAFACCLQECGLESPSGWMEYVASTFDVHLDFQTGFLMSICLKSACSSLETDGLGEAIGNKMSVLNPIYEGFNRFGKVLWY